MTGGGFFTGKQDVGIQRGVNYAKTWGSHVSLLVRVMWSGP